MKKSIFLIVPIVLLTMLSGFFGYKWLSSVKTAVIHTEYSNLSSLSILEKLPSEEIVMTYKDNQIEVETVMLKSEISNLLDEYNVSNFMTSAVLLFMADELPVKLTLEIDFLEETTLTLKKVKLDDYEIDTNIQIK